MILQSLCNSCLQPFQILLESGDAELIRQLSEDDNGLTCKCPRLCGGRINIVGSPIQALSAHLRDPLTISAKELYQAVNGMGLPDEIEKDPEVIKALLLSNKTVGVSLEHLADGRIFLHEINLENGYTIHLAAGSRGSQVLKVTKERHATSTDSRDSVPDRA